ncbi:hypothetical protein AB4Z52_25680 [Rhizobium sp. 2YAF20]|uniref:hypothetical protein n=1 Tax=Rhizobium sp. 2YAF20 TaxID=3233027 RepID=UPI003F94ED66
MPIDIPCRNSVQVKGLADVSYKLELAPWVETSTFSTVARLAWLVDAKGLASQVSGDVVITGADGKQG